MRYYILVREFILDNGDIIAGVLATATMGALFGIMIGSYLAGGF